ncbi:MAG: DUF86 domain-containing protein [Nanoarchaeota archaeon]|nr:DUF86 domain-containing protein [Nanoarchaeota archaeon]
MYDIQRIGKIITDIEKFAKELSSYKIREVSDLSDSKTFHATSMVIFGILNRTIDLGSEILFAENLGAPNTYQDIMPTLAKANIIDKERAEKLNKMINKRNILAHFYGDIKEKDLLSLAKNINLIEDFVRTVKKNVKV